MVSEDRTILSCIPTVTEECDMTRRRKFTAAFKAKGSLEGDRTIQEIAARHKVHPNLWSML